MRAFLRLTALFILIVSHGHAQVIQSVDTIKPPAVYENVYSRAVASDSLSSSFVIYIRKEVKAHRHLSHTENVYILEGSGEMMLGDKKINVKKGDIIFIPKNTLHSFKVTSRSPAKILSIQSPMFDGKDRIFVE